MFMIVAHHYVVNSGLLECVSEQGELGSKDVFLLLFGWGGKTGINCFVLITGYFMCKSNITLLKWLKLFLEVEFYKIVFWAIFTFSGYIPFSLKGLIKAVFPFTSVSDGFVSCFLLFYLFIPFINRLISNLSEREHLCLIVLNLFVYTVLPSFVNANVTFNYVMWFAIVYVGAAYIRMYPKNLYDNTKFWLAVLVFSVLLSWTSVVTLAFVLHGLGKGIGLAYFFVNDSNKIMAVVTSLCAFMFFKSINISYSRFINTVAASTFGVLMIHANSDAMRAWLWHDVCNNVAVYSSGNIVLHAIGCVAAIYIICTLIDYLRIRFVEKPMMKILRRHTGRIEL